MKTGSQKVILKQNQPDIGWILGEFACDISSGHAETRLKNLRQKL